MTTEKNKSLDETSQSDEQTHDEESVTEGKEETSTDEESTKTEVEETEDKEEAGKKGDNVTSEVKHLRKESGKRRIENKVLKQKVDSYEDAISVMSARVIRSELKAEALKEGLVDLDALKMFDTSSIEMSEEGDILGIPELVVDMKKKKSYLFKKVATKESTSSKTSAPDASPPNVKSALKMTDEEYEKAKAAELAATRNG